MIEHPIPPIYDEKSKILILGSFPSVKSFLLRNRIAVWDVIGSCDVMGSSDSSIKNVVANDH